MQRKYGKILIAMLLIAAFASLLSCEAGLTPWTLPPGPGTAAPTVAVSGNPTQGDAPLGVNFNVDVTLASGATVQGYAWTFGDTGTSQEENPSHTYNDPGIYTARCIVTDSNNKTGQDTVQITVTEATVELQYVGSDTCGTCHSSTHDIWVESGHPYKLNKVDGGPPTYPFSSVPNPPDGITWDGVNYVIGGYGWKARFIGTDGYIITGDAAATTQYNLADQGWVAYHAGEQKAYDCGKCHTTGWESFDDNGGVHQDGLEGIAGTWAETGVGCEACHGPGSDHVDGPSSANITKDSSAEMCGTCHTRDSEHKILVKGDLVRHHEQYDEFTHTKHGGVLTCNSCHDPHAGTLLDDQAAGTGVIADCTDCHSASSHAVSGAMASLDCTDCHMPLGAKSAIATGEGVHKKGDVHNHIWAIDTTGIELDGGYFDTDGSNTWIAEDGEGLVTLSLAWACMQCHDGTSAFTIDSYSVAAAKADGIHD